MDKNDWLAQRFEENRGHLRGVAYRMLGSLSEADDAIQETWLRLSRSDSGSIQNLSGWLTTVIARVEESLDEPSANTIANKAAATDPEQEVLLADSVGIALLVI